MNPSKFKFKLEKTDTNTRARAGLLSTLHGDIQTPVFMPVATQAAMRGQDTDTMRELGTNVLLGNTFHLLLRPGPEVFKKIGGIHKFMNWDRSVLTDSGGFQIFSLVKLLKITDEGASFRSYVDGEFINLTPEASIEMQKTIGSDIMMVLDQCIASTAPIELAKEALLRTTKWAKRSLAARGDSQQALFGITQGACYPELRKESITRITEIPFDGYAIGGLAVGEDRCEREDTTELSTELLPIDKPRYLMGVGTPIDLLEAVKRGVDMFDCILPTSLGLQGVSYTSHGKVDLRRGVYKFADVPLDAKCACKTCKNYSRAYLSHLFRADEYLGGVLVGYHNLHFYLRLMESMRLSIVAGEFQKFYDEKKISLTLTDEENPTNPPIRKERFPPIVLGNYEVIEHQDGYGSIRQVSSGEVMHSVEEPIKEARKLYLEQSKFADLIRASSDEPLVVWDVGLGAATNAMAAIEIFDAAIKNGEKLRKVRLVSFENDITSLTLALYHPRLFAHLRHAAPQAILKNGRWTSKDGGLEWTLISGDFLSTHLKAGVPRIIFFDPFSYKTDSTLWSSECFESLFKICSNVPTELYTYSASTLVRSMLLGAGWFVAKGAPTGPKSDTTIALTKSALKERSDVEILDSSWLGRWERSDSKVPSSLDIQTRALFERKIREHEQFLLPSRD